MEREFLKIKAANDSTATTAEEMETAFNDNFDMIEAAIEQTLTDAKSYTDDKVAGIATGTPFLGFFDTETELYTEYGATPDAGIVSGSWANVGDLDVTAPGSQGTIYANTDDEPTEWQVNVQRKDSFDPAHFDRTVGGAVKIADDAITDDLIGERDISESATDTPVSSGKLTALLKSLFGRIAWIFAKMATMVTTDTDQTLTGKKTWYKLDGSNQEKTVSVAPDSITASTGHVSLPLLRTETKIEAGVVRFKNGIDRTTMFNQHLFMEDGSIEGENFGTPRPFCFGFPAGFYGSGTTASSMSDAGKMVTTDPATGKIPSHLYDAGNSTSAFAEPPDDGKLYARSRDDSEDEGEWVEIPEGGSSSKIFNVYSKNSWQYTGAQIRPSATVKDGNTNLTLWTHYDMDYGTNKDVGTGSIFITGIGDYLGWSGEYAFLILPKTIILDVSIDSVTNDVVVKDDRDFVLIQGTDYELSYGVDGVVTVIGIKNYSGSIGQVEFDLELFGFGGTLPGDSVGAIEYDLTAYADGVNTVFDIDPSITDSAYLVLFYAGQRLIRGEDWSVDFVAHELTTDFAADALQGRKLILEVHGKNLTITDKEKMVEILQTPGSGSIDLPSGYYKIAVTGGGGGGAKVGSNANAAAAGGGAGAMAVFYGRLAAGLYDYVVGSGGTGGTASGNTAAEGNNGAASVFTFDAGASVTAGAGAGAASANNSPGGAGGAVTQLGAIPGKVVEIPGQAGDFAAGGSTTAGVNRGGRGGSTPLGNGGIGGASGNTWGRDGSGYGAGGGGGYGNSAGASLGTGGAGGSGTSGVIIIESV